MSKSKGRRLAEWLRNLDSNSKASSATLADDSITAAKLQTDAVTNPKIADGAVHTANLADANVTFAKLHTDVTITSSTGISGSNDNDTTVPTTAALIDYIGAQIQTKDNSDEITEGSTNLYFTNERVDDRVNSLLTAGTGITLTYDDTANTLTVAGAAQYGDSDVASYLSTNGYGTSSSIIASITDSAPTTLDTLNELAAALGDDANFSTTVTNSIGTKWTQDNTKISNWDTAYGWGNHASAGYITTAFINDEGSYTGDLNDLTGTSDQGFYHWGSTQPTNTPGWNYGGLFVVRDNNQNIQLAIGNSGNGTQRLAIRRADGSSYSGNGWTEFWSTADFSSTKVSNWDTAYGWGNHASAGYITSFDITTQTDSKYLRSDVNDQMLAQLYGGFGAVSTAGTTDWNHSTNARSGGGYTLLTGSASNGPGGSTYYHPFSFEYSSKNGNGNMTQLAIPYNGSSIWHRYRFSSSWSGWVQEWNSGNDGSGSGLDADTLDGNQASAFAAVSGATFTGIVTIDHNTSNMLYIKPTNGSPWAINIERGDLGASRVYTHNYSSAGLGWVFEHMPYDYNGGSPGKLWGATNDGSGSGLDADTLDGQQGSYYTSLANATGQFTTISATSSSSRDKIRVYPSSNYAIGMQDNITYGHLNDWAMTFQMNDDTQSDRGFWWGDTGHGLGNGAMSLTTNGRATIATSLSIGQGESITGPNSTTLYVGGNAYISGATTFNAFTLSTNGTYAPASVGHTASYAEGIFWHSTADYSISRTAGAWSSPNYDQLNLNWPTGIYLNGGTSYGLSGVRVVGNNNSLIVNGNVAWNAGNDGSGSGLDADTVDGANTTQSGGAGSIAVFNAANGYLYTNNWVYLGTGQTGIYSSLNGAHWYPGTGSTYGTWTMNGNRNSYGGFWCNYSSVNTAMHDSGGNGGTYRQANNRWYWYHHVGNNCTGFSSSTTSSAYSIYSTGAIYSTGNITAYSDRRVKENIIQIDSALDKVNKLEGVYYNKIDDETKIKEIGFIAQDVQEVVPELVTYAEDVDEYGVKYGNATALLVEAVKELTQQVNTLKKELEELKNA